MSIRVPVPGVRHEHFRQALEVGLDVAMAEAQARGFVSPLHADTPPSIARAREELRARRQEARQQTRRSRVLRFFLR